MTSLPARSLGPPAPPEGMRHLAGGPFRMGSDRFYPEEAPSRRVAVGPFWIDEAPVTNAAFAKFVAATGYVTLAERAPPPGEDLPPELAQPGAMVFNGRNRVPSGDGTPPWWRFVLGACWRQPLGPSSSLDGLGEHPVVHITSADAEAYAHWAGKALPTEAEWEFAARGGLDDTDYAWGDELSPGGAMMANTWQGRFPHENLALDGWERTSPVGSYPANGFGLYDMIGNVWEWTTDWWALPPTRDPAAPSCCVQRSPTGGSEAGSHDPGLLAPVPRRVIKGGSHLCAPNYCRRYRPAARHAHTIDTPTSHIGFRCVIRDLTPPG